MASSRFPRPTFSIYDPISRIEAGAGRVAKGALLQRQERPVVVVPNREALARKRSFVQHRLMTGREHFHALMTKVWVERGWCGSVVDDRGMTWRLGFALSIMLACAGCDQVESAPPPQRLNIELTGTPECLAHVGIDLLSDLQISPATMPVWSTGIGRQEFGPVEVGELPAVKRKLRSSACLKAIRQRPCATPLTDVAVCLDPRPLR